MSNPWERLKEERIRLGHSQEAFAQMGGVQKRSQVNYEKGERRPDAKYFEGIAAVGANVDYILTGVTAPLRVRLNAMDETTKAATSIDLPAREGAFVRDVMYGMALKDPALVRETIENYVAERQAKTPRKKETK